ncbi:hypothetical protein BT93_L4718 [Corymbia citriodora subsp. variegata]|uniref:GST N-terminal domain-containing protein n=1 Tax=Corymbia citriodora subsp. variegata TaxID=360336 RepID=A0A8T0CFK1_CORYI|nr:hypothetical protein BT93_L4718 [Corymbia citriodora subsp. variegata]
MSDEITLYDLASRQHKCWSLNPWKTRFVLNFKQLPYNTIWLEYPDIKPTLSPHLPPNSTSTGYSSPTIRLPTNKFISDSRVIATELEQLHPEPSMNLDSVYLSQVETLMPQIMTALAPLFIPEVPKTILNDASLEYWYETREKRFDGMKLDQVAKEQGGDIAIRAAQVPLMAVSKLLIENEGPFFEKEVGYVDFVWCGFLVFMVKAVGEEWTQKIREIGGVPEVHEKLVEAMKPWLERDDH